MEGLPGDHHVHSEWSWDAPGGSMERTCARAVELGLPSVAFTEHADFTPWKIPPGMTPPEHLLHAVVGDEIRPPHLDVHGYLRCLERCRERFAGRLRIVAGVELSEPHRHGARTAALLASAPFERVLASVHALPAEHGHQLLDLRAAPDPAAVLRATLAETLDLVERFDGFEVLAHIDYPVRSWPAGVPYRVADELLTWWRQEGGAALSFASDAHRPDDLAHRFAEAARVAGAAGFRPGTDPFALWRRS